MVALGNSESIALLRDELWKDGLLHSPHNHRVDLFGGNHPEPEW